MKSWISSHWRAVLQAGCAVTAALTPVVPALAPAALVCAVAVPVVTQSKNWQEALAGVVDILKGQPKK